MAADEGRRDPNLKYRVYLHEGDTKAEMESMYNFVDMPQVFFAK